MSLPLPMPLEILLTAGLETALNQLLALDERAAFRRQPLHGKVLQLDIRELKPLWLVFSPSQVDILTRYSGAADAGISLNLDALPRGVELCGLAHIHHHGFFAVDELHRRRRRNAGAATASHQRRQQHAARDQRHQDQHPVRQ